MRPFLYHLADTFYTYERENFSKLLFVFPNQRSGKFFQHYLGEVAAKATPHQQGKAFFSPRITTINNLMVSLSQMQMVDKIDLLFTIYEEFAGLLDREESFDKFVFWGELLLSDFDDVDKYMVDARQLFTNIKDLKDLEQLYLEPEQLAVIRQFWDSFFLPDCNSERKVEFNRLWNIMLDLYHNLRNNLAQRSVGYEGMIFRAVAEKAREGKLPSFDEITSLQGCERVIFVGFNALTEAERVLMQYYRDADIADFYWDSYAPTLRPEIAAENRAGYFIYRYVKEFPSRYNMIGIHDITTAPEMTVIPISSGIGQVKQAGEILKTLIAEQHLDPSKSLDTAVVLPDEDLLIPMVYSIPEQVGNVNVTMGYNLKNTSVASLFEAIFQLQRRVRWSGGKALYYHVEVAAILNHRTVVMAVGRSEVDAILATMKKRNMVYVPAEFLTDSHLTLLSLIFTPIAEDVQAPAYLDNILEYLIDITYNEDDNESVGLSNLEHEYTYHYQNLISRVNDVIEAHPGLSMNVNTYFALLSKIQVSMPFVGEPLSGLQVMGVLETRVLDFKNIIILSMNDGIFPKKSVAGSFIPYNLRSGYGLSTTEHQDSIYAYYFYRMIARAERVFMLYDTRHDSLKRGEPSRFIFQLKYHYARVLENYNVKTESVAHSIKVKSSPVISIDKKGNVAARLSEFLDGTDGKKRLLSASTIKTYINCPLQFYLQTVERMRPDDDISEEVDSSIFGSIYHNVMAAIYDEMKGENASVNVTKSMIDEVIANRDYVMTKIEDEFVSLFFRQDKSQKQRKIAAQYHITLHTVHTYIISTLEHDSLLTPFIYVASELEMPRPARAANINECDLLYPLPSGKKVRFKALIDRVDYVKDCLRIVDYKTGSDLIKVPSIAELFNRESEKQYGAIFQVLLYCKLYRISFPDDKRNLQPLIYKVRDAFKDLSPALSTNDPQLIVAERRAVEINDYDMVASLFEPLLDKCLEEIFDLDIPFTQTAVEAHCKYCDFKTICKRN